MVHVTRDITYTYSRSEEEKSEKEGLCPRLGKPSQVYLVSFSEKNH